VSKPRRFTSVKVLTSCLCWPLIIWVAQSLVPPTCPICQYMPIGGEYINPPVLYRTKSEKIRVYPPEFDQICEYMKLGFNLTPTFFLTFPSLHNGDHDVEITLRVRTNKLLSGQLVEDLYRFEYFCPSGVRTSASACLRNSELTAPRTFHHLHTGLSRHLHCFT
jgi:hypothetical protein